MVFKKSPKDFRIPRNYFKIEFLARSSALLDILEISSEGNNDILTLNKQQVELLISHLESEIEFLRICLRITGEILRMPALQMSTCVAQAQPFSLL